MYRAGRALALALSVTIPLPPPAPHFGKGVYPIQACRDSGSLLFGHTLRAANVHEYDIADLLGHSTTPGETRNTKVTRGYAHAVPQRLRDAVNALERGKLLSFGTPTLHQQQSQG
jgi:hypothetical protein